MTVNALLQSLMNEVYTCTNRPDKIAETKAAIISSTLKMHGLDYFFRDIFPAKAMFDVSQYIQALDTSTLPRFRSVAYIRKWDNSLDASLISGVSGGAVPSLPPLYDSNGFLVNPNLATALLKPIDPTNIFDEFGSERTDVYYQAGNTLMIRSSTALSVALVGWYQWPNVTDALYDSWIARDYKYAIIYDAASNIFASISQQDQARKYDAPPDPRTGKGAGLVWSHIDNLLRSNVTPQGY